MNKRKIILPALVLAIIAGMAAFQLRDDRFVVVPPADTHLVDIENQVIDLASFKGKVVFINNWASWCPPCIAEMPSIQALKSKLDTTKVEFLMVSFDENRTKATRFMNKRGFDFKVYFPGERYPYFTPAIPATFILDKQGQVVFKHEGMADYSGDEIVAQLKALAR